MIRFRSENNTDRLLALVLIAAGVFFRLMPHPDNFTPALSLALFAGVTLPPALALSVPLFLMMISDWVIGPHSLYLVVWASFLLMVGVGIWAGKVPGWKRPLMGIVGGSFAFFVLSNLGVFLFENMYPKTWAGLVECFVMALPFFRNSMAGDLFYTFCLFSLFAAAQWMRQPKKIS